MAAGQQNIAAMCSVVLDEHALKAPWVGIVVLMLTLAPCAASRRMATASLSLHICVRGQRKRRWREIEVCTATECTELLHP